MVEGARGVGGLLTFLTVIFVTLADPESFFEGRLPPRSEWKTRYACENSELEVRCADTEVIRIMLANYGRYSISVCNRYGITEGWNLQCISVLSYRVVSERCDGRRECRMMANNRVFGDPCPDTTKYAEVKYYCEKVETPNPPTPTTTSTTTTSSTSQFVKDTTTTTSTASTITTSTSSTSSTSTPPQVPTSTVLPSTSSTRDVTSSPYPKTFAPTPSPHGYTHYPSKPSSFILHPNVTQKRTLSPLGGSTARGTTLPPKPTQRLHIRMCKTVRVDDVIWPATLVDRQAKAWCPNELTGFATWQCSMSGWVGGPDLSNCVSPWVEVVKKQIDEVVQGDSSSDEVVSFLESKTEGELNEGDIKHTTQNLMPKLQQALVTELHEGIPQNIRKKRVKKFAKSFLNMGSNILADKNEGSWNKLSKSESEEAATSLIVSVEETAFHVAKTITTDDRTSTIISENVVMEVNRRTVHRRIEAMSFPQVQTNPELQWKQSDRISIPAKSLISAAEKGTGEITVVFVIYNNLEQFLQPRQSDDLEMTHTTRSQSSSMPNEIIVAPPKEKTSEKIVNSHIISAAINNREERTNLVEPVEFTLEHLNTEHRTNPECSFWEMDSSQRHGRWSQEGCRLKVTNSTHTTCQCDHLTNFAVLMDVKGTKLSEGHRLSLRIITYVGCIISIICLLLSWITFIAFKNLQCDRTTIHKHLVYSLMVAEIIFLVGIGQTDIKVLCSIIAGLLHFLFLVAFAWMCLEGVQLYVMLIEVFETERSRLKWYYLFAYGIPLVIVSISAAVYHQGYGTSTHCWLTTERHFIWSFVGPALFVMTVNMIMLSIAIYMMCRHANMANSLKEKSKLQKIRAWIKGAVVLVVLLGLTWCFGLLYLSQETVAMAYIFTILNSLQGVFIFVFHCLMNEKVQKEYRKVARRTSWLPNCIRVNYGGYNGHMSSSPNQSSGSGHNYFSRLFPGRRRKRSSSASTNSSTKPFLSSRVHRRSDADNSTSHESSLYPSSINGYVYTANNNDPQKSPKVNGFAALSPWVENGIAGDLSEALDCSVIDSEAVTEYCHHNLRVSEEKKRYSSGSETEVERPDEIEKDRLSALSYESINKHHDSFVDTDDEKHSVSGMKKGDSERSLINNMLKRARLWKGGSSRGRQQSPSLSDINSEKYPEEKLNTSTPNIKYKDSPKRDNSEQEPVSVVQQSMPDLSFTNEETTTGSSETLMVVNPKVNIKRLSSDIQIRFDPHRYDYAASNC